MEEVEEVRELADRHLDVLNHLLACRLAAYARSLGRELRAAVPGDDLPVDVTAQLVLRPEAPDERLLRAEGTRAPEPVGVPAPDVVVDGEQVFPLARDRAVVDVHAGVVARGHRAAVGHHLAEREVLLGCREHRAVEEVHGYAIPFLRLHDLGDGIGHLLRRVEAHMAQAHVGQHRLELDLQPQGIAEGAVGVGEAVVEVAVGVVGRAADSDHLPIAGEDVHLDHRLVRQAPSEAGTLDPEARDGSTQGDGLQLRHAQGHEAVGQRRRHEVLVGRHALHLGGAVDGVDLEHAVERGDVEPGRRSALTLAEEVGGALGQSHGCAGRDRGVLATQIRDPRVIGGAPRRAP